MILPCKIIKQPPQSNNEFDYNSSIFIIGLSGKIDKTESMSFWIFVKTMINGGAHKILLDMRDLDIMDSKGIGKMISLVKLIRTKSGEIAMVNKSLFIKEIFISLNVQEMMKVFPDEKQGLQYLLSL